MRRRNPPIHAMILAGLLPSLPGCAEPELDDDSARDGPVEVCGIEEERGDWDDPFAVDASLIGCHGTYVLCDATVLELRCSGSIEDGYHCACLENGVQQTAFDHADICTLHDDGQYAAFDARRDTGCGWGSLGEPSD